MKKKDCYRHGDILIKPTKEVRGEKQRHLVLAEGEVTGHAHRIAEGKAALFRYNEKMYLKVISPFALLRHEEHKEIKLPRGDYEIEKQQEWKEDGWQKVVD